MTQYIIENEFRNCNFNNLSEPVPLFTLDLENDTLELNYDESTLPILKILAVDDTIHDLSKDRDGYKNKIFNEEGPLNYLLTGNFSQGNHLENYKNLLNYKEFNSSEGGNKFESAVTKSVEINRGLQGADTIITYDEIIAQLNIVNATTIQIHPDLMQKVISSNGSVKLIIDKNNPRLLGLETKKMSFSNYITAITQGNETTIQQYSLKISYFIKWFLHTPDFANFVMPEESMKILSDAGIGFLGDIFGIENSNVTPFIAVPCFLDSASTSIEPLDPNVPIFFEEIDPNIVVPVVSNYFSCHEYFICYLLNEGATFDINSIYNFSLAIFKINPEIPDLVGAINYIRGSQSIDDRYYQACSIVKQYIDTNPGLIARYYFGEVKKQQGGASDANDLLECGTCGAGVPYLGKVLKLLLDLKNNGRTEVSGLWLSQNIATLKTYFNTLKNQGPLNSRIPISDSRILKLFCYSNPNGTIFMNMTNGVFYSLFKLLADYKRTGDYQQSYTVLKQILKEGNNARLFTFSSGDELSTLVGRLLSVPSIYQVGVTGSCSLFRCTLLNASQEDRLKLKIKNYANVYNNYKEKILYKFKVMTNFVTVCYANICILRGQINSIYEVVRQKVENNNVTEVFLLIKLWNAYYILNRLIVNCNVLQSSNEQIQRFFEILQKIYTSSNEININMDKLNTVSDYNVLNQFQIFLLEKLKEIAEFENTDIFALYNNLNENYPLFLTGTNDYFAPLTPEELRLGTFTRTELGLEVKNMLDNEKNTKTFINYILSQQEQAPQRASARGMEEKAKKKEIMDTAFVNSFNIFIDSMKINDTNDYYPFNISNASDFIQTVRKILDNSDEYINTNEQKNPCDMNTLNSIIEFLTQIVSTLTQGQGQSQEGGNNFSVKYNLGYSYYNQKGGTIQSYNKFCLYNEINKLLINLLNKCSLYISNVIKNVNFQTMDMAQILLTISNLYETDSFCQQILFDQPDEYVLENEGTGFVIALKLLAEEYSYSDILENTLTEQGVNYGDELLIVNNMLNILELPYVKLVIFLLLWRNVFSLKLSSDLINFDLTSYSVINGQVVVDVNSPDEDSIILECTRSFLNTDFHNFFRVFEYLRNQLLFQGSNETFSIFSIITLASAYFMYYGYNSSIPQVYNVLFKSVSTGLKQYDNNYSEAHGLKSLRNPPEVFLKTLLPMLLNLISSDLITKLGAPAVATGPAASARGLNRAAHFSGEYQEGGKTRKLKKNINKKYRTTIKKQFIKRSKKQTTKKRSYKKK